MKPLLPVNPLLRNAVGVTRDREAYEPLATDGLEEAIARNVRTLRIQASLSVQEAADRIGISKAMLSKIENCQTSPSLATVAKLARGLDVPATSLFRDVDTDREAAFVAAGTGAPITRNGSRAGHRYESLGALRGSHKRLEALMVTLDQQSETYPLFQHPGTEVIFLLDGVMEYGHGRATYRLEPGDSLLFDGEGAHGPTALVELPIRFISVIAFPDATL